MWHRSLGGMRLLVLIYKVSSVKSFASLNLHMHHNKLFFTQATFKINVIIIYLRQILGLHKFSLRHKSKCLGSKPEYDSKIELQFFPHYSSKKLFLKLVKLNV